MCSSLQVICSRWFLLIDAFENCFIDLVFHLILVSFFSSLGCVGIWLDSLHPPIAMEQSTMIWIELARPICSKHVWLLYDQLVFRTWCNFTRFARALCGSQWWASTSWHSNWLERKGFGRFLRKWSGRSWCLSHTWILDSKEPLPFLDVLTSPKKTAFAIQNSWSKALACLKSSALWIACLIDRTSSHHFLVDIFWVLYYTSSWLPTYEPSVRTRQDASNVPTLEPSLADAKPSEATEAVEVPWTCGRLMRKATNDGIKMY